MRRPSSSPPPLRDRIREAGLRATPGRIAVLAELERRASPVSHSEQADALEGEELDRVTVWRILVALTEAGLADRVDHGDRTWRFEKRREAHGAAIHPHFMCVSCKAVECLPESSVRVAPRLARSVTEVQLKGRCADCR
ncbi:MAG: transcriptional repressor [Deltaproteobacteria bacterium]|nr:transcriptional repressor [Deltaproteobacteria bacterium]